MAGRKQRLELDAPNISAVEKRFLARALDTGFVSSVGPFVGEFEEVFARRLKAKKAVAIQSGTAALHMALREAGVGPGDEVIVPPLTFIATVNPIVYLGARPVFADVDPESWNIDPAEIRRKLTKKTRAIVPVHLYGNPCDMEAILGIARAKGLAVVEDATESLGATWRGRSTGTLGDFGCFSFNGNKVITTGGGGMVTGRDQDALAHIKFLANQAKDPSNSAFHPEIGFNFRMTNIEAALGLAQMKRLESFLEAKRETRRIYEEILSGVKEIRFSKTPKGATSSHWLTAATFGSRRPEAERALFEADIPFRRVFMPVMDFPPYRKYVKGDFSNARRIYEEGLCLPSSTLNSRSAVRFAAGVLKKALS